MVLRAVPPRCSYVLEQKSLWMLNFEGFGVTCSCMSVRSVGPVLPITSRCFSLHLDARVFVNWIWGILENNGPVSGFSRSPDLVQTYHTKRVLTRGVSVSALACSWLMLKILGKVVRVCAGIFDKLHNTLPKHVQDFLCLCGWSC